MDGPSQRQLRVGEEMRRALAAIFERRELRDPHLTIVPVTVTEAKLTPDLRHATFFVTPLGGTHGKEIIAALGRARPFLRHRLAEMVNLKFAPNLSFRLDTSFEEAGRIANLLHSPQVARDLDATTDFSDSSVNETAGRNAGKDD